MAYPFRVGQKVCAVALFGLMSGCMKMPDLPKMPFGKDRTAEAPASEGPRDPALDPTLTDGSQSEIITDLIARPTVLRAGAFRDVSDAVMAANSRTKEAELRVAMLKSQAASRNWLPRLGPRVSLTSLGTVVASMVVDQVLFDSGGKKAERAVARADVEVAAVALSQDSNDRVRQALELYIDAEAAEARARVNAAAMERMEHFEWVMQERVRGGINDRGDLQVVSQKLAQMRSDLASDRERARGARAELAAMSALPLDGVKGLSDVRTYSGAGEALAVLKARAEARRAAATADAARAGFLPSLGLSIGITADGATPGVNAGMPNGLGFDTGAQLAALDAQKQAAEARITQVSEASNRALRAVQAQLAEAERKLTEARAIATHAAGNYDLFAAQLEAGRRAVPDVVGVFETKLRTEREASDLAYEVARHKVKIAALRGALVAGDKV